MNIFLTADFNAILRETCSKIMAAWQAHLMDIHIFIYVP